MLDFGPPLFPEDNLLVPEVLPPTNRDSMTPWPSKLPLDLALGAESEEQILLRHNVSQDDYVRWAMTPAFRRALAEAAKDVREQGLSFKLLCQGIAMDFLPELDSKLHDPTVGFAAKMDAFKQITELAGLKIKEEKAPQQNANLVQININI